MKPDLHDRTVEEMAALAGLRVEPERIPLLRAELSHVLSNFAPLLDIDTTAVVPTGVFDAEWK
jgi:Asp-tRNA(Asn)/Glu-tRNA(Gln) amidotransferase C subunit